MNPDHARFAEWDSAYVLGALSPSDRREFEEHLEICELCRRAVAELAADARAARPALARAGRRARRRPRRRHPRPASRRPPRRGAPRRPASSHPSRARTWCDSGGRGGRARPRRDRCAARASCGRPHGTESVAFEAAVDAPLTATATLTQVAWGTRIELDCRYGDGDGMPTCRHGGWPYALVVIDRRRHAQRGVELAGDARAHGARSPPASAVDLDDIASLEIRRSRAARSSCAASRRAGPVTRVGESAAPGEPSGRHLVFPSWPRTAVASTREGLRMNLRIAAGLAVAALAVALTGCTTPAAEEPPADTGTSTEPNRDRGARGGVVGRAHHGRLLARRDRRGR